MIRQITQLRRPHGHMESSARMYCEIQTDRIIFRVYVAPRGSRGKNL